MVDFTQLLTDRPDVLAEYNRLLPTIDWNSPWAQQHGFYQGGRPEDFAKWWYNQGGGAGQYNQVAPPAPTPTNPTSPTTPVTTTTPQQDQLTQTVNDLLGLFNQQQAQAQQQSAARENARSSVASALGTTTDKLNSALFGNSINDILQGQYDKALTQLDRGLARGMYNQAGYDAGLSALGRNRETALVGLNQTANDLLSGYRSQYDTLRNDALNAANNFSGSGSFNLNDYINRANEITNQAKANLPGALLANAGTGLFDLGMIRNEAGAAQGATNLNNLDVMEALTKRKQAEGVGRGLGSQGSF